MARRWRGGVVGRDVRSMPTRQGTGSCYLRVVRLCTYVQTCLFCCYSKRVVDGSMKRRRGEGGGVPRESGITVAADVVVVMMLGGV